MDFLYEPLDILFRKIRPEELYEYILKTEKGMSSENYSCFSEDMLKIDCNYANEAFFRGAHSLHHAYSNEEIELIRSKLSNRGNEEWSCPQSVFTLLPDFTKDILTFKWGNPLCSKQHEHVFRWRELSFRLGQDILTTAHRASQDCNEGGRTTYFAWPTVIHVNNPIVSDIVDRGLAENHSHLYGAIPPEALSWVCIMNHPEDVGLLNKKGIKELFSSNLVADPRYASSEREYSITWKLLLSTWIRTRLFQRIISEKAPESVLRKYEKMEGCRILSLSRVVSGLRLIYGQEFKQMDCSCKVLDYAFPAHLDNDKNNGAYRLLVGERYLLYSCFCEIFNNEFSEYEKDLFYLYLLLKTHFRNELIQINQRVGFHNFLDYQDRKNALWEKRKEYMAEGFRIAVFGKMEDQNIKSQEDRITPSKDAKSYMKHIRTIDEHIYFARKQIKEEEDYYDVKEELKHERFHDADNFYVIHFPKHPTKKREIMGRYLARNYDVRDAAKAQAYAMADALIRFPDLRYRIRGIDACSREIGCRPETFATEFRFLRHLRVSSINNLYVENKDAPWPRLCATYHAGEDFLDLADGLRAIDETIRFLEFESGDRIGHALAMGVDPEKHYRIKRMHSITTKQDRLDDLTWLLNRSREFNIYIPLNLLKKMENEATDLLMYIFADDPEAIGTREVFSNLSLSEYYESWSLRGEHPTMFSELDKDKSAGSKKIKVYGGSYNSIAAQYALNMTMKMKPLPNMKNPNMEKLHIIMHQYHYGKQTRCRGEEVYEFRVTMDYIELIRAIQDKMIQELTQKGIYVECNPSSNYLIGTIEQYKNHPIFRFNQYGMGNEKKNTLCVSVNTDDMGVFDTSLENEYALLAAAMEDTLSDGERVYDDDVIFDYLEHLRIMGHRQTFKPLPCE